MTPEDDMFRRLVLGEVTVDEYVADVKRRVAIARKAREASRRHRKGKPIAFQLWRPWGRK